MKKLKSYLIISFGITLCAIASGLFYIPNNIVTGGVSGLATILFRLGISPGIVYVVANSLLLLLSCKYLGRDFVKKSVYSIFLLSFLVQIFSFMPPITENVFLASFFGSCILGFGTAITFSENANTGGSDILGRLIQAKGSYFPIGSLLLIIDSIIILISLLVFKNIELCLFGIFGLIISSIVIDYFIGLLNSSKLALVITEKGDAMSDAIITQNRRGVTVLNARGAYSKARKKLLICAIKNSQMADFRKTITEIDEKAFIIFLKNEKIFGLGFYVFE